MLSTQFIINQSFTVGFNAIKIIPSTVFFIIETIYVAVGFGELIFVDSMKIFGPDSPE